jgi:type II secretory pathway pseudopilin PulG
MHIYPKKVFRNKGGLLLELLIVVSLLALILSVGAQGVFVSLQSGKVSGERDTASKLATEGLEATRAVAEEKWQNIFNLTKTSQHYQIAQSGNKWVLAPGDETITLNNTTYTRYVIIEDVSRDLTTRLIEPSYTGANNDPGTQKVTVTVTWGTTNTESFSMSDYFFRWKNKICNQTDWSGGAGNGVRDCSETIYESISPSNSLDTSGGQLKLQ